jgi:hypothetical protein
MNLSGCAASRLAEAMDTQPPVMPEDGHTTRVTSGDDGVSQLAGKEPAAPEPIWDDEDTRSFYESLPDLRYSFLQHSILSDCSSDLKICVFCNFSIVCNSLCKSIHALVEV